VFLCQKLGDCLEVKTVEHRFEPILFKLIPKDYRVFIFVVCIVVRICFKITENIAELMIRVIK